MSKSSTSVIDGGKGVGGKGSEPDFEPFYAGVTLLKFGRSGKPKERVLYLSRSPANRFLSWRLATFVLLQRLRIRLRLFRVRVLFLLHEGERDRQQT